MPIVSSFVCEEKTRVDQLYGRPYCFVCWY